MPEQNSRDDLWEILQFLADESALRASGADDRWVELCRKLVQEYLSLKSRVASLESKLSTLDGEEDTVIF